MSEQTYASEAHRDAADTHEGQLFLRNTFIVTMVGTVGFLAATLYAILG